MRRPRSIRRIISPSKKHRLSMKQTPAILTAETAGSLVCPSSSDVCCNIDNLDIHIEHAVTLTYGWIWCRSHRSRVTPLCRRPYSRAPPNGSSVFLPSTGSIVYINPLAYPLATTSPALSPSDADTRLPLRAFSTSFPLPSLGGSCCCAPYSRCRRHRGRCAGIDSTPACCCLLFEAHTGCSGTGCPGGSWTTLSVAFLSLM